METNTDAQELTMLVGAYREYCEYLLEINNYNTEVICAENRRRLVALKAETFADYKEAQRIQSLTADQLEKEIAS